MYLCTKNVTPIYIKHQHHYAPFEIWRRFFWRITAETSVSPGHTVVEKNENYDGQNQEHIGTKNVIYLHQPAIYGGFAISVHLAPSISKRARCDLAAGQDELRGGERGEGAKFLGKFLKNAGSRSNGGETYARPLTEVKAYSALSSLFRSSGSAEVMGTHGGPVDTRALRDLSPPPLQLTRQGVFLSRHRWPGERVTAWNLAKNRR